MIECVSLQNSHHFTGNPILEQHKLRYGSIIKRQGWDVPTINDLEYDSYDNPAAYYLIKRDDQGKALGASRFISTTKPYMLQESFSNMVTKIDLPKSDRIWEGSRFCIDSSLPAFERKQIMREIVVGYLEFGLMMNIEAIIGLMYPVYWKNIFIKSGWNVEWLGDVEKSDEGYKIIAGWLPVSEQVLESVRKETGVDYQVLDFGSQLEGEKVYA